ncbi:MAG: DNA adenine methylase [Chitinophagales bacterium]|nr:DNA adenine methylase [Chitinophagales bacterium]
MKTPITYYGGKQRLLKYILPLIPQHTLYAEPFTGGGAVFFSKEPSEIEIINDTNQALITFYKITKSDFRRLNKKVQETLHSRVSHKKAQLIYANKEFFQDIDVAWSVWMLASTSFASMLGAPMGYDVSKQTLTRKFNNKKKEFTKDLQKRLENANIESRDACHIITSRDTKQTFFYCDPPYFNADMGHYKGYTEQDFERLLKTLSNIKGKFLLSSYPSELLTKYIKKYNWHTKSITQKHKIVLHEPKEKTEVLTANYEI